MVAQACRAGRECGRKWQIPFEFQLTPWAATRAHASSFTAPAWRCASAATPASSSTAARPNSTPAAGGVHRAQAGLQHRPLRQRHRHGREALQALRKGRGNSSMWAALQSVKDGEADVAISGGNTGALMAMATFCLRPIEGISRPAIAAIWPTLRTDIVVLDVGATVGGDAPATGRFLHSRRGSGPRPVRPGVADRRPAQRRHRRDQGPRRGQGRCAHARPRPAAPASPITASSRATTSARAPSTSWSPKASPATSRSRPPRARPARSAPIVRNALRADLLSPHRRAARRPGAQRLAPQARPAHHQRRRLPRAQRHRHQEPWRHRRDRLQERARPRLRNGAQPAHRQDRRGHAPLSRR